MQERQSWFYHPSLSDNLNPLDARNICFMGSNVESGTATAMVVNTGICILLHRQRFSG
jgi:magnesium-transporting ATPase (P-type)